MIAVAVDKALLLTAVEHPGHKRTAVDNVCGDEL